MGSIWECSFGIGMHERQFSVILKVRLDEKYVMWKLEGQ